MPAVSGYADNVGTFIDAWDSGVIEPYKNISPILSDAKLSEAQLVGGVFHVATRLTFEGGTTFAPSQTNVGDGSSTYVGPRAGYIPDARVEGMQIHGKSRVTYEAISRSMSSVNADGPSKKKAVQAATMSVADGILQGTIKKCEALMIHGRRGIGQLDSAVNASNVVDATTTYESTQGYHQDVSLSAASWSEAMWLAFEGHTFDIFANTSGVPSGTKLNTATNTLLTGGANQTGLILTAINPATPLTNGTASGRALRFWSSSGTAGVVGTGVLGGYTILAASAIHICFESGGPTNEFVGLMSMAGNTGTLFNIAGGSYSMYRGNVQTSVGNIRLSDLVRYLARPINAGAQGKRIRAVVPTELFSKFANDEATLRRYAAGTGDAKNGFDSIEMYLPMKSTLEILGHPLQKDGEVLCYVPDCIMRVGSQDLDFVQRNGRSRKDAILLEVQDRPASELRLYGHFAPICQTPRHMLSLTGVTF